MKSLSILFLLIAFSLQGQIKVVYNYTFAKDSLDKASKESELMVLSHNKGNSNFYSLPKYKYDSIAYNTRKISVESTINIPDRSKIKYEVVKNLFAHKTYLKYPIDGKIYSIEDTIKITWHIFPDTKDIFGYKAQKAQAKIGGRLWQAWFTNSVPVMDGPYKLYGLPGLILEAETQDGSHSFKCVSIVKNYDNKEYQPGKTLISYDDFKKFWQEYKANPTQHLKSILGSSQYGFKVNYNGQDYSTAEILKEREKQFKEEFKKNNNYIDLILFK